MLSQKKEKAERKPRKQRTLYLPSHLPLLSLLSWAPKSNSPSYKYISMIHTKSTCQDKFTVIHFVSQSTQQQIRPPVTPSIFLTGGKKNPTNRQPCIHWKQILHIREHRYLMPDDMCFMRLCPGAGTSHCCLWPLIFNGGMPGSFKVLCHFLNESHDKLLQSLFFRQYILHILSPFLEYISPRDRMRKKSTF